jgi:glycosyltransferase involved in cell wall biosynthesis
MLVALDATPLTVPDTGIGRYVAELSRHLAALRPHDRFVLFSDQPYPEVNGRRNLVCDRRPPVRLEKHWWSVGLPMRLARRRVRLFHGTDFAVPIMGGIPSVVTIHDLSPLRAAEWRMPETARRIAERLPLTIARARAVIVPSKRIATEVRERFPRRRVYVTPLAASAEFRPAENPEPPAEPYLLFAGTREPRKNLVRLLDAFAGITASTALRLILAGRAGWGEGEVRERIAALGLQSKVTLCSNLTGLELARLYQQAAVFVYPSLYEGFGLPVLEAMACGAPVVTSRHTACAEVAGGAARLVDPYRADDIAAGILDALRLAGALRARGLARAREFSWKATAELTWKVYESALHLA